MDISLYYQEQGEGEPLILLHGNGEDGANIAIKFALRYSNRVKALILNGGNLNTKGVKKRVQIPIEIGYRFAKLIAGSIPNAKLSIIKGNHFIAQKRPQEFNREVEAFLRTGREICP